MKNRRKYRIHLRTHFALEAIHISGEQQAERIIVTVRDEGIGIPEEKQAHIFDAFYQCEESHKKDGNGLALSIVKRILELLDGRIECKSVAGKGTQMTVTIQENTIRL